MASRAQVAASLVKKKPCPGAAALLVWNRYPKVPNG